MNRLLLIIAGLLAGVTITASVAPPIAVNVAGHGPAARPVARPVARCAQPDAFTVTWGFTNTTGQPVRIVDSEGVFGLVDLPTGATVTVQASYPASDPAPIEHIVYGDDDTWGTADNTLAAHRPACGSHTAATLAPGA